MNADVGHAIHTLLRIKAWLVIVSLGMFYTERRNITSREMVTSSYPLPCNTTVYSCCLEVSYLMEPGHQ